MSQKFIKSILGFVAKLSKYSPKVVEHFVSVLLYQPDNYQKCNTKLMQELGDGSLVYLEEAPLKLPFSVYEQFKQPGVTTLEDDGSTVASCVYVDWRSHKFLEAMGAGSYH